MFEYLQGEKAHPSGQFEEDAVLDSVSPHLGVQHGDQAGQRSCTTIHANTQSYSSFDKDIMPNSNLRMC